MIVFDWLVTMIGPYGDIQVFPSLNTIYLNPNQAFLLVQKLKSAPRALH
jgi:hypothetical protein